VRQQVHPKALELLDPIEPVLEGYNEWGEPNWRGVSMQAWEVLVAHPETLLALVAICQNHFPTACAVLLKVRSKRSGGLIPFIFNKAQVVVWNRVSAMLVAGLTLFIAILKARQLGISTFVLAWEWWNLWRLRDSEVLMVGHQDRLIQSFVDTLRRFHEELPNIEGIKPRLRADNSRGGKVPKRELYYADRRTKAVTVVSKAVDTRGLAAPNQHYSEFAFYENPEGILLTLMPMLPPIGSLARKRASIFIETTPNGKNYFYEFWQLAKSGESDWQAIFIPWMVAEDEYSEEPPSSWRLTREDEALRKQLSHERRKIDGRDVTKAQMYWRHLEMANQGWNEDKFDTEYPSDDESCFLLQARSLFKEHMRYLQRSVRQSEESVCAEFAKRRIEIPARTNVVRGELQFQAGPGPFDEWRPKKFIPTFGLKSDGRLSVWSPPQVGHAYCCGIDTAEGVGRDASVAWVLDVTEGRQVAEWYSKATEPEPFTDNVVALGYWYNTATLYPEVNSIGRSVMKRMKRVWMYPRVGLEERWDEPGLKPGKFGLMMNEDLKEEMVLKMLWFVRERYIGIASNRTLSEISTFEDDDGKYRAAKGAHDDCVVAMGLACMVVHQTPKLYSTMTRRRREEGVPSAFDLGLSKSEAAPPIQTTADPRDDPWRDMPTEIRKVIENARRETEGSIPTNPIRG
jgi:hypothetical protein